MSKIEFYHAWFLVLALSCIPVYLLARRAPGDLVYSSLDVLPARGSSWRTRFSFVPSLLLALAAAALGVAFAGPRIPDPNSRITHEGIAIMMVVDTSGSMRALDLSTEEEERTRLDALVHVFEEFVAGGEELAGRPDDAIGVVSFARYADTRCPLTLDHGNVLRIARDLSIVEDREEDGTAIGDGLALAVERLRESEAKSRVAILLTDGVNNAGEEAPTAAAELAATHDVKIYTIGAGTMGMAPVRVQDPFTGQMVLQPMAVEIDEATLREIADRTGGSYFRATDAESLHEIYREIDHLERTELIEERYVRHDEYYGLALAVGLVAMCAAWLLGATVLRRSP